MHNKNSFMIRDTSIKYDNYLIGGRGLIKIICNKSTLKLHNSKGGFLWTMYKKQYEDIPVYTV